MKAFGSLRKVGVLGLALLAVTVPVSAADLQNTPEVSTGWTPKPAYVAEHELVVTTNPLATQAGYAVLENGGNAMDAAVAVQAMLTLVEPQSSGIGGGGFMLYWNAAQHQLYAYDGRETAPRKADEKLFLDKHGKPLKFMQAVVGGRSVGTPGILSMLEVAQRNQGFQPWSSLFADAIKTADEGFKVSPRLHESIEHSAKYLKRYPAARNYFFDKEGKPLAVDSVKRNPQLAESFRQIAEKGSRVFYSGPIAQKIVDAVHAPKDNPGLLSLKDLSDYQAVGRAAVCAPVHGYSVCGFPPPSSGGVTSLQTLGIMESYLKAHSMSMPDPQSLEFAKLFTQASRLAYADRDRVLADPRFVKADTDALLNADYLTKRAALINLEHDMGKAKPGAAATKTPLADDRSPEYPSTSHFVIVDRYGSAVSMTSSVEHAFGSTLMAGGFILNNELTDFSFVPRENGHPVANRVQPGKRPRSSMAPTMVFDDTGELVGAIGSPGGSHIINYVSEALVAMLWQHEPMPQVVSLGHISNRNGVTALEKGTPVAALAEALRQWGQKVDVRDLNSGLHAFRKTADGHWEAGIDPRREGTALGD